MGKINRLSTSRRHRAYRRAAEAWLASRPHEAWEILAGAGLVDQWPEFLRVATVAARRRYVSKITAYGRQ